MKVMEYIDRGQGSSDRALKAAQNCNMTTKERMEKDGCSRREAEKRNRADRNAKNLAARQEGDRRRGFKVGGGFGRGFNLK